MNTTLITAVTTCFASIRAAFQATLVAWCISCAPRGLRCSGPTHGVAVHERGTQAALDV